MFVSVYSLGRVVAAVAGGGCVTADGVVEALAPAPAAPVPVPNYNTIADALQTGDSSSSNYNNAHQ